MSGRGAALELYSLDCYIVVGLDAFELDASTGLSGSRGAASVRDRHVAD